MPSVEQRAIVVGHKGQDGRLLTRRLLERGVAVVGVDVGVTEHLGAATWSGEAQIDDPQTVMTLVREFRPDEVYYLAARHASSQGQASCGSGATDPATRLYDDQLASAAVNVTGPLHFLEALRCHAPRGRFFFASSSLIFGSNPSQQLQSEATPLRPDEPYAWQKALTGRACADYRTRHGLFASIGILFNHESSLRPPEFLSAKIVQAAVRASRGLREKLVVGNLDAVVDWGSAADFVEAFMLILALDQPGDFVVATGEPHTVRDFARIAFSRVGLDWEEHVTVDARLLTRNVGARIGDSAKLRAATGWRPSVSFDELVEGLVDRALVEPRL